MKSRTKITLVIMLCITNVMIAQVSEPTVKKRTSGADFERIIVGKWLQTEFHQKGNKFPDVLVEEAPFMEEYRADGSYYVLPALADQNPDMYDLDRGEVAKHEWKFFPDIQVLIIYYAPHHFTRYKLISMSENSCVFESIGMDGLNTFYSVKYVEEVE